MLLACLFEFVELRCKRNWPFFPDMVYKLSFFIVCCCFPVTYKWRVLPLPSPNDDQYEQTPYHRYGHTAVAYSDRAYIFGGRNDKNGACNILFCFDAGNVSSVAFRVA